ncbi:MAG: hypothetical protein AAFV88_14580 [Planctomycetota bacterium]
MFCKASLLSAVFVFSAAVSVHAEIRTVFDFESVSIPSGESRVDFSAPLVLDQDGIEMTISHENGIVFSVNERTGDLFRAQFDRQALSAFNGVNGVADPGAFLLDFDRVLDSITVEMGDIGGDEDALVLEAYDAAGGTGNLIGRTTGILPAGGSSFGFDTLSVGGGEIRSVRMIGGSAAFPNSVFYDNIAVTAIPEPSFAIVLACGGVLAGLRRKREAIR